MTTKKDDNRDEATGGHRTRAKRSTSLDLLSKLLDRSSPWVVVPNGSHDGFFDWVPAHLRVGPWHPSAVVMLFIVYAGTVAVGLNYWEGWTETDLESTAYPPVYSAPWWYHTLGCLWMFYIMVHLARTTGLFPWITYTMQAWTMLTLRHALCAMAPWSPWATGMAERMRFLCAITTTQTFVVWNFVLMPVVYFVLMKGKPHKQKEFLKFSTSFVMMNIHGLNIVLCWCNVGSWGSPRRHLEFADFYVSVVAPVVYSALYLGIWTASVCTCIPSFCHACNGNRFYG